MNYILVYMQYQAICDGDKATSKNSGIIICDNKEEAIKRRKGYQGKNITRLIPWEPYEDVKL